MRKHEMLMILRCSPTCGKKIFTAGRCIIIWRFVLIRFPYNLIRRLQSFRWHWQKVHNGLFSRVRKKVWANSNDQGSWWWRFTPKNSLSAEKSVTGSVHTYIKKNNKWFHRFPFSTRTTSSKRPDSFFKYSYATKVA